MERNFARSLTREKLPPLAPGRTSLVAIKPKLGYELTERLTPRSPTYLNGRCPPPPECFKRQRPVSGNSPTYLGENIKRQRPSSGKSPIFFEDDFMDERPDSGDILSLFKESDIKRQRQDGRSPAFFGEDVKYLRPNSDLKTPEDLTISGHACTIFEPEVITESSTSVFEVPQKTTKRDGAVKSFSVQQIGNENSPTPNFSSLSAESATKPPKTPTVNDAKAEKKRKRRERKEKEARKFEEARLKEQEKLEKERQVEELSRNRSMFNGNRDTLPMIGRRVADANFYIGKMPKVKEVDLNTRPAPDNNVVNVIHKHEAQVHTSAFLRKISHDYINASAQLMDTFTENEAIDIIEAHEDEVGRKHAATNHYVSGSYSSRSGCRSSSALSRCSSGVSRRVAF